MAIQTIQNYTLGDMTAHYLLEEESGMVELMLLPAGKEPLAWESKRQNIDPLMGLKLTGDVYTGSYAGGCTMHQSGSCYQMKYHSQKTTEEEKSLTIQTICKDQRGYEGIHTLIWEKGEQTVRSFVTFINHSSDAVTLEKLDSFCLGGITPYLEGDAYDRLSLYRIRGVWSMEGRLEEVPLEDLQLEPSWAIGHAVRCERFGGIGSLPVNRFFPFFALEDKENHIFWGAQLAHNASWQMEIFRRDEAVSVSGGLADRDFGHWYKNIKPQEAFTTPEAILTVAADMTIDTFSQRLTAAGQKAADRAPACEQELPIIFNEYCTTWGCPSHENIKGILAAIKDRGFSYFVIDCGWFKADGVPWDISMGDYIPSHTLFPEGLEKTVAAIREAGLKPGIWFEIDNVGSAAHAYQETEKLLTRDGQVLTTQMRRFWDMRNPEVIADLTEKVIGTLRKYGFEYMKMDYNDTIGIGCDGAESLGEGLRQNMDASFAFVEKIKQELPDIILENCASGGHKLEPRMMGITAMASFSDAHECPEIPIVAANLHRVILPRQSQIWAVIRETDSLKRIAYSMAATFLGRMCLSGDVTRLTTEQWEVIDKGMAFYRKIAPVIKDGLSYLDSSLGKSWRHPMGWQSVLREGKDAAFVVLHIFDGTLPEEISVALYESKGYRISEIYSDKDDSAIIENDRLIYRPQENQKAVVFYMERM